MSASLRFLVIAVLLMASLVLGVMVVNMTRVNQAPVQVSQEAPAPLMVSYLVAAHPLPAGTLIKDDDLATRSEQSDAMRGNLMADTPESRNGLRGSVLRNYLDAGAAVTAADVLRPRDRGFIASVLHEGYRAVSVGVDPISGVAGLIWPGDHVDVLLTQDIEKAPAPNKSLSETVLSDVRVIAIDQEIAQGAPAGNTAVGKLARTVTLEVDPQQAQKLAVAAAMGKLSLSIRAAADSGSAMLATTYAGDVSPALSRAGTPAGKSMRIIQGKDISEETFR
jgi:pilus assembly protein CpaB